jgi:hypothetical protein
VCVFVEVVAIGDGLTSLADGLPVHHITCRHYHVMMKGKLLEQMSPEEWCGRYCSLPTAQMQGCPMAMKD